MVRLKDGQEGFVTLGHVFPDEARFLRNLGKRAPLRLPERGGWSLSMERINVRR